MITAIAPHFQTIYSSDTNISIECVKRIVSLEKEARLLALSQYLSEAGNREKFSL